MNIGHHHLFWVKNHDCLAVRLLHHDPHERDVCDHGVHGRSSPRGIDLVSVNHQDLISMGLVHKKEALGTQREADPHQVCGHILRAVSDCITDIELVIRRVAYAAPTGKNPMGELRITQ
jgi:hypothetical protein